MTFSRCGETGKVCYTRRLARRTARRMRRSDDYLNYYFCERCGRYHVGHPPVHLLPFFKEPRRRRVVPGRTKRDPHLVRAKTAQLQDNVDTINTLAETVTSVEELTRKLEMLFNDGAGAASVMCSTVHKAKGLEADRVWILEDTLKSGGLEEENIRYVAYTRARKELCLVSLLKGGSDARAVIEQSSTHDVG